MIEDVVKNYRTMLERVRCAEAAAGRPAGAVRLLAVSKFIPPEQVRPLLAVKGIEFGENRAQELSEKAEQFPPETRWHFIGALQANKVRKVVRAAAVIESIDSVPLLEKLDRVAAEENRTPEILLEVNISGEASKSGIPPEALPELARRGAAARNLRLRGLMTMAPDNAPEEVLSRVFGGLAAWRERLERELGIPLPELSMGMSGDFEAAIRAGSTQVRIGTAIFGARPVKEEMHG